MLELIEVQTGSYLGEDDITVSRTITGGSARRHERATVLIAADAETMESCSRIAERQAQHPPRIPART
jgi:hypothetical protein